VTSRLAIVVAQVLQIPVEEFNDDLGLSSLGQWTSLKHIQLVAAIEDAYSVRFSPREIRSFSTVGGLRDILINKGIDA
jgi:acyl carrier protein